MVTRDKKQIICTHFCAGKEHDFELLKKSRVKFLPENKVLADSGYQGFQKIHSNTVLPKKNTKLKKLSPTEKTANADLSSERVVVENIIASLKRFRIFSGRYRNRRKRFSLRFNLISAIHNFEL